jgi:hypothetical protein
MEVKVLSHQSRSGQVRTESCVRIGNDAFDAVDRSRAGCKESAPKESEVVEAECVRGYEGSMCTAVSARWCRSTGVVACVTYERSSSEPRRPDRVRRNGHRRGLCARENHSARLS